MGSGGSYQNIANPIDTVKDRVEEIWNWTKNLPALLLDTIIRGIADLIDYITKAYKSFNDALVRTIKTLIPEPAEGALEEMGALNATLAVLSAVFQIGVVVGIIRLWRLILDIAPVA